MDEYKFYSYVDDKSILVITSKNKLVRIRCPFQVKDNSNKVFQVDAVSEINGYLHYKIDGKFVAHKLIKIANIGFI